VLERGKIGPAPQLPNTNNSSSLENICGHPILSSDGGSGSHQFGMAVGYKVCCPPFKV
jgi:hypothetical protein